MHYFAIFSFKPCANSCFFVILRFHLRTTTHINMINFIKIILTLWLVTLMSYCNAQTHEQIKKALKGSKYKKEIYKVILFETGRLKSKSLKEDNNLFGMQCPQFRETTASACRKNEYTTFAVYDRWEDSIDDFFIWMDYCNKYNNINDFRDFYDWLRANNWNTVNPNYYATLKRLKMDVVVVGRKSRPATIKKENRKSRLIPIKNKTK